MECVNFQPPTSNSQSSQASTVSWELAVGSWELTSELWSPADGASRRGHRPREVRLPGLRCAGRVEPGEAEADLPVLRHGVSLPDQSLERRDRGDRSRQDAARTARFAAWLAGGEAQRALSELPGGDGVRPVARRAELRVLWIAGPGGLQGTQGPDQPAEPAAVSRGGHGRPRADPAMVREQVVRPGQAESAGARGHGARRLPAVLDVRRAGDVPVAC